MEVFLDDFRSDKPLLGLWRFIVIVSVEFCLPFVRNAMRTPFALVIAAPLCTGVLLAADPFPPATPPRNFEIRGFLGLVVPNSPKSVPTGDFRTILYVIPKTPAAEAGIKPGDYILSVDGQSTAGLQSFGELLHLLQGAPGSKIRLELKRITGGQVESLTVTRVGMGFASDFPKD